MTNEHKEGTPTDNDDVVIVDQNDPEGLAKNLATSIQQKKYWREKAKAEAAEKSALEARLKEYEAAKQPTSKKEKPENTPQEGSGLDWVDNFAVIRDLNGDELSELRSESSSLGLDLVKYVKSKAGQAHLKEFRSTKKVEQGTPTPSSRVATFNGKPINDILRDDNASPADKQAAFEAKLGKRGVNQSQ